MRTPPCKSCQKTADSGKKQSASKKICSSITGILTNEIGKTKNKTKLDILEGGLEYANDICDSGGAPDLAKITKGLPEKDKARISQKTNAALFDGAADLPDRDFGPASVNTAPTLTGGGQVADLKVSEPDTPKLNAVSEFSLAKPSMVLASTKTASATSVKATKLNCLYGLEPMYCTCLNGKYIDTLCEEDCYPAVMDPNKCPPGGIGIGWDKFTAGIKKFWEDIKTVLSNIPLLSKIQWESIKTVITNLPLLAKILGKAVLDGIWAGIKWPFAKIGDALAWLATTIVDYFSKSDDCQGKEYNPKRLCCTAKGPMIRSGIKNLSDCAQRYTVGTPLKDGCHTDFPMKIRAALSGGGLTHPLGKSGPNFGSVCNSHIWCYGNCTGDDDVKRKTACDVNFDLEMIELCKTITNFDTRKKCHTLRNGYYDKIAVEDGPKSYESSQKDNCSCCEK